MTVARLGPPPAGRLPSPTTDLDEAREDLARCGFCIVADALSSAEVTALRARLREQADGERARGIAYLESGGAPAEDGRTPNQRVFALVNKGEGFRDIAVHPLAMEMMRGLLGEAFLLSSLTANIAGPGSVAQPLHMDQTYVRNTPYPAPNLPLVANVAWALDDVCEANGGTRFVPGSHLADDPYDLADEDATVAAEAPAGSAIVFEGRVLHGTGANRTDALRHVLLSYYCQPFMRQQENATLSLAPEVYDVASPELKRLLGFEGWYSLGRVYDQRPLPADGFYRRPEQPLTELDATGQAR